MNCRRKEARLVNLSLYLLLPPRLNDYDRPFVAQLDDLRNLTRLLTEIRDLDTAYPALGRVVQRLSQKLGEADKFTNDFTEADLRRARLDELVLTGVRWSERTRWPSDWEDRIRQDSLPLASDPGVFVILGKHPPAPQQGS